MTEALVKQKDTDKTLGAILIEEGKAKPEDIGNALNKQREQQERGNDTAIANKSKKAAVLMKIDAARLDAMSDAIGELVVAQGMINGLDGQLPMQAQQVRAMMSRLNRICRTLQDMSTSLRLVPVQPVFQKMAGLCRSLARKTGKQFEFHSEGGDVELDKNLVDRLGDPLVHMVRNSVDHGLEPDTEKRLTAGKTAEGTITLRAYHDGGSINIEISDDGQGLNQEKIRDIAIERGVISADQELTENEINMLIFKPGFSTASEVTDLSGRGVGMDVVKRMVEDMRGHIVVHTQKGEGTSFTFVLPLTAAIIDGMLVQVGDQCYVIPTLAIHSTSQIMPAQIHQIMNVGNIVRLQDDIYPLFELGEALGTKPNGCSHQRLGIILTNGSNEVVFMVDAIIGRQQCVLKPLGSGMPRIEGVSGATLTPQGQVALIVDANGLISRAMSKPGLNEALRREMKEVTWSV